MSDNETNRSFPLHWPDGYPRTNNPKRARFDDWTVNQVRKELEHEIKLFGGKNLIISSNLELKLDGAPRSGQRQPQDTGVAIYFTRKGVDFAMPEDLYTTVQDNLRALVLTLEFLRGIERHGGVHLVERAFKGFIRLADPLARKWHEILGVSEDSDQETVAKKFKILAMQYHPDYNHNEDAAVQFDEIKKAYDFYLTKIVKK